MFGSSGAEVADETSVFSALTAIFEVLLSAPVSLQVFTDTLTQVANQDKAKGFFPPADGASVAIEQNTSNRQPTNGSSTSKQKTPYRPPSPIPDRPSVPGDSEEKSHRNSGKDEKLDSLPVSIEPFATVGSSIKKTRKISDEEGSLGEFEVFGDGSEDLDLAFNEDDGSNVRNVEIGSEDLAAHAAAVAAQQADNSEEDEKLAESGTDFLKTIEKMPGRHKKYQLGETPQPSSESGMRFDELYRLKGVLGTGAFSTVREGYHRSNTHQSYAVKCINRKKLSEEDEAALLDEVSILKEMKHVHIIRLFDFFTEPSTYYLVMERMRGGELFDRIVAKAYYNEKEARDTCKIVLDAVGHCHRHHVAHRDLKPENLLLLSESDDSTVKIADFGFAKKVYEKNSLTTQCGTPGYVAPEILEGTPYDERADMWSVGVILYILLGGYPPFIESTQRDLFRKIRKGEYEFHEGELNVCIYYLAGI